MITWAYARLPLGGCSLSKTRFGPTSNTINLSLTKPLYSGHLRPSLYLTENFYPMFKVLLVSVCLLPNDKSNCEYRFRKQKKFFGQMTAGKSFSLFIEFLNSLNFLNTFK